MHIFYYKLSILTAKCDSKIWSFVNTCDREVDNSKVRTVSCKYFVTAMQQQ